MTPLQTISYPLIFAEKSSFPRKRCTPLGTPIVITVEKIAAREINAEELPIIVGVVIFDMTSQKKYPENNMVTASI